MATVAQIIEQYNTERPNQIADEIKVIWLRKFEHMIINEVLMSHEHDLADESTLGLQVVGSTLVVTPAGSFEDHINNFGMDSYLLIPEPYDDVYIYYLDQRIALNNNDKTRYNTSSAQYNNALLAYQQYINRTYITKKVAKKLTQHSEL